MGHGSTLGQAIPDSIPPFVLPTMGDAASLRIQGALSCCPPAPLLAESAILTTGLGDLVQPERILTTLRTIFAANVQGFGGGEMGAVNGMLPDGSVDGSSLQSAEVWIGITYALAATMLGRGLTEEGWQTARGAAAVTYERGPWFRTPEAYDAEGGYRASLYLRPLAIWAIEHALAGPTRDQPV